MSEPTVPLREHLEGKIDAMASQNAEEHAAVLKRLEAIEKKVGAVVTWPSLGFALVMAGGLYALADRF